MDVNRIKVSMSIDELARGVVRLGLVCVFVCEFGAIYLCCHLCILACLLPLSFPLHPQSFPRPPAAFLHRSPPWCDSLVLLTCVCNPALLIAWLFALNDPISQDAQTGLEQHAACMALHLSMR